tara:strand:+ start:749 stop:2467 length:1719 start_codon:yes stop_codon:yes gene_type:complete
MEKIKKLRNKFKLYQLDGYIIPKNDEYFSEYVPHHKDNLKYISNFTGSYGIALILKSENILLVDGRYTVQANNQSGSDFKILTLPLCKKDLPKINGKRIGYDPRIFNESTIKRFKKLLNINFFPITDNLINFSKKKIYSEKKKLNFYLLNKNISGISNLRKLQDIKRYLIKNNYDLIFVTSPENVAWLLNIRGEDSDFSPIPNSRLIMDKKMNIFLFCDLNKINKNLKKKLYFLKLIDIEDLDEFLLRIKNKQFSIDKISCSIFYINLIIKNNLILNKSDPIYYLKSIKNNIEIKNTIKAHEYDGAALTKFIFWVKKNYEKKKITEISAQNKLFEFKKKCKKFKNLSFPTISSTGSNGAIVHYNATNKTNKTLKKGNLYLVDSGGQYYFGTTDVTRTISLGSKNKRIKEIFTRVLQGHLNLTNYKVTEKTTGSELDQIARKNLKKINLDYSHGTGHGVGFFLNVHEGPQSISKFNKIKLKPGMILSNEPGYYKKGEFGLRIENLIFLKKKNNKKKFYNLTYVPIDKSLIIKKLMNKNEIAWLNEYHKIVYTKLKKYMNNEELVLLKQYCSNI